ncbi:MAG: excinuclease ABC subunit UvrA [Candidatus Eremiobacter antarcticus]|nr:excinuclease ABC subunit UvrA [Candidatus Eremiobacteraeota bacterium]MBC5808042.1 excinuclease ABC subunit UvrA [Candidatus Eremiobacteraeota bacterium]PZR63449.1 MAG: excinuclease ABC subunit UvrA [Candidatus Eremiobacter sp. RRmetagenome_bin22]
MPQASDDNAPPIVDKGRRSLANGDPYAAPVLAIPPRHGLESIVIKGAREHNLKNIDLTLPRNQLIVITGLSGSGKSSLAFDTIYAEGQRRYVESLSSYARQFLGQVEKPDVDYIEGMSPAISIDQKSTSRNPRSTVGTVTEIYDYLRLLYARIGKPHCPNCGRPITPQSAEQIVDQILALPEGTRLQVLGPMVRGRKGEYQKLFEQAIKDGYARVRVDGQIRDLREKITIDKKRKHTVEIVIDRLVLKTDIRKRLTDSVETALKLTQGVLTVMVEKPGGRAEDLNFSEKFACIECGLSFDELSPRMFSFNSPYGACPECTGLGARIEIDPRLVIPDRSKSLREGAIAPWSKNLSAGMNTFYVQQVEALLKSEGYDLNTPVKNLPSELLNLILYGEDEKRSFRFRTKSGKYWNYESVYRGIIPNLQKRFEETSSDYVKNEIEKLMTSVRCPACKGARLKPESLAVTIGRKSIAQLTALSVDRALEFVQSFELTAREEQIGRQIVKELRARLGFLVNVGLEYLTLDRSATTLSGGEAQRIRLATQIGSSLVGVLYVLDEPSIGLHQRDNARLLATLKTLRDLGNTLIVVEHDEDTMREADYIVDMGPAAGKDGGRVVAAGTIADIENSPHSATGRFLSGVDVIPIPRRRRVPTGTLTIRSARANNLQGINVDFPLGVLCAVTGVSGSGKSTLVDMVLHRALAHYLHGQPPEDTYGKVIGLEKLDKVIIIDQSPIGRTPRSNPATYTGAFDPIREMFSLSPDARVRGYGPGRFSFNVKGGRCETCAGDGIIQIEMHFLPDVYVECEACKGRRYNQQTLEVKYKGKSIADVLQMRVDEASEFFANIPRIHNKLSTICDVGLGYIQMGQPATTLSGGEAQRVKLATELSRRSTGRTFYILDEPTTGLHFADIAQLLLVLQRLVSGGNTVLVIEHNLDVIKTADYVIDLGPEGGEKGGKVVATGTPEEIALQEPSHTGRYLRRVLSDPRAHIAITSEHGAVAEYERANRELLETL